MNEKPIYTYKYNSLLVSSNVPASTRLIMFLLRLLQGRSAWLTIMRLLFTPRPLASRYFWIRDFFFPDTASVHTHPARSAANPDSFESDIKSRKNNIAKNPITCCR